MFSDEARIQFIESDLTELPGFNDFDLTSGYSDGRTQNQKEQCECGSVSQCS